MCDLKVTAQKKRNEEQDEIALAFPVSPLHFHMFGAKLEVVVRRSLFTNSFRFLHSFWGFHFTFFFFFGQITFYEDKIRDGLNKKNLVGQNKEKLRL